MRSIINCAYYENINRQIIITRIAIFSFWLYNTVYAIGYQYPDMGEVFHYDFARIFIGSSR